MNPMTEIHKEVTLNILPQPEPEPNESESEPLDDHNVADHFNTPGDSDHSDVSGSSDESVFKEGVESYLEHPDVSTAVIWEDV